MPVGAAPGALRELVHAWRRVDTNELLEAGFTTRTCNLGGAHCEAFENRAENIRRTTNSTIPAYNALSDPHLAKMRPRLLEAAHRTRGGRGVFRPDTAPADRLRGGCGRGRDAPTAVEPRDDGAADDTDAAIVAAPMGTEHVLAIKRLFFRWSHEMVGVACRSPHCAVQAAGVGPEHVRLLRTTRVNLHALVCSGVAATNHYAALHQRPTLLPPSVSLLYDWLLLLDCVETTDWPSFLLLCTADLHGDYATVAKLRNSYDCFIQQSPTGSERVFRELVAFLFYNHQAGAAAAGSQHRHAHDPNAADKALASFFQSGDFYRARHICSFAETIFSLMPHRVQFYLCKANGRGFSLATNFLGHGSVFGAPGEAPRPPPAPHDAVHDATQRAAETHRRWKTPLLSKRAMVEDEKVRVRFRRRVWA